MLQLPKWRNAVIGFIGRVAAAAIFLGAPVAFAHAATINVYSTIAMRGVLEELVPQFQKESGHTLAITWGTAAMLTKRIEAGEPADVALLTKANIETLTKGGKIAAGTDVELAASSIAVAIKSGAKKPDISSADALKETLLKAKSIAYSDPASGGASGVYFAKLLEQMGIAEQMKGKTKHPPAGGNAAALVATREAELAIQQKPEIMNVAGVDVVGPLPGDLNKITVFAAGIIANSKNTDAAKALLKFLQSDQAQKMFKASGFDPD
jgi:molybdate transport system substrate-binding protein